MSFKKKLLFSACFTLALLILAEVSLRLFTSVAPFQTFKLLEHDSDTGTRTYEYCLNPEVGPLTSPKPEQVYRILCFGGSATRGTPFVGAGFPDFLRAVLERTSASRIEVINLGADGFTSAMVSEVFQDALMFEPDLCIIHSGNNEVLGFSHVNRLSSPGLYKATWWVLRRVRLVQLPLLSMSVAATRGGAVHIFTRLPQVESIYDSWLYPPEKKRFVRELYIKNIDAMVQMARAKGVRMLLVAPGSNLRDWIPMKSVHGQDLTEKVKLEAESMLKQARADLADKKYDRARQVLLEVKSRDPHYARLYTFLGWAELGLGNTRQAAQYLEQAVEYADYYQQSPPEQNRMLMRYAADKGLLALDADFLLRDQAAAGLPGFDMFVDGCHLRPYSNYLIALDLRRILYDSGEIKPAVDEAKFPDYDSLRQTLELAEESEAMAYLNQALVLGLLYPHKEYLETAYRFLEQAASIGEQRGILLSLQAYLRILQGRPDQAAVLFTRAKKESPEQFAAAIKNLLGDFVRYDDRELLIEQAQGMDKAKIYKATLGRKCEPPEPAQCELRLVWDEQTGGFTPSRNPTARPDLR